MYTTWLLLYCHSSLGPVAAPENVQVEASEDKPSIFVNWSPVPEQCYNSDSLTGYHVLYTPSSKDCRGGTLEVLPEETSCSLDFLDRGVAYAVSVAAVNDIGIGPYSTPSVAIVGGMLYCAHRWQPPVWQVHTYLHNITVHSCRGVICAKIHTYHFLSVCLQIQTLLSLMSWRLSWYCVVRLKYWTTWQ